MTAELVAAALLVALALALELSLRLTGFGSFPLFERDEASVYRMRRNQAGYFRHRFAWNYDANGMRNDDTPPSFAETTLLIGDSIVDGGLGVDQSKTLAALARGISGENFYSVACHGWALANILPALEALPGWTTAKRLVFVLNSGDLDTIGGLGSELSFPTRRPIWLTLWIVRRQAFRRLHFRPPERAMHNAELRAENLAAFRKLLASYAGPVVIVRYAMRGENARSERYFEDLASLEPRVRLLEAADALGWADDCYADHIHPNARGLEVLAGHLCEGLG